MNPGNPTAKKVAIIGGGIAGLAAAYTLQTKAKEAGTPITFTLFESAPKLGGKILTEQVEGYTIEGGPDSFLLQKPWAAQLAQELGLEAELRGTNPAEKRLYVVNRGRLTKMPDGVMLIIPTRFMPFITSPLISWPGKMRMGMDFFIPRRKDDADESVGDFIRRRLGREALEKIAEPLMSGIHVSDPEQQSLLGTFPRFRALEKKHGSLIRGMLAQRRAAAARPKGHGDNGVAEPGWKSSFFITLRGGMGQLVEALENALTGGRVRKDCRVMAITRFPNGTYWLDNADGTSYHADAVILAAPAFNSAELVNPFAPQLAQALKGIRYVSTATVSLAYRKADVGNPLPGVGMLAPRHENRRISACTMTSTKFYDRAPAGRVLLRCFVGGPGKEELVERSDAEIIADARAELAALMGVKAEPEIARVYRWIKGNAQYDVGHLERVAQMHALCTQTPGLFLTGSAFEGIGIPDCVHQGQQAAEKVMAFLSASNPVSG